MKVEDLDHLGIIAGIIDQMGLIEGVNGCLGTHPQQIVSPGLGVKAMILNGLGFVSAPLYLYEGFFEGKATEHLLGAGIKLIASRRLWFPTRSLLNKLNVEPVALFSPPMSSMTQM